MNKDIETKWQKIWKENKVFEPKIDENKEKYVMTVAYPYANSVMHIGHGRTFTMADIIARFQRLNGKNVLYPMGFHISGTPVLAVADNILRGDEKQIKQTREAISEYIKDVKEQDLLLEKFKDPFEIAKFFSSKIEETFDSIGLSIDWSRQFSTGDKEYNKFIEWQYSKLKNIGILVQDKYPILYSVLDGNAVGEDDIKDADVDKVTIQEMTYILFKLEDVDEYLMITTLRPDAIFGTTNMWLNPKHTLVKVKFGDKIVIVNKLALDKLKYQFDNVELLDEFSANDLIGKNVITPLINRIVPIVSANFVDENHGSGVVYSSPAGSPHDFIGIKEANENFNLNLEVINTVDNYDKKGNKIEIKSSCPAEDMIIKHNIKNSSQDKELELAKQELYKLEHYGGKLNSNAGDFEGVLIKKAKDLVKNKLVELGLAGDFLETSRRAVTRSGDRVIVAKLDGQWFLDYRDEKIKQKAYDLVDNLVYRPEKLRDTQIGYLKWVQMRPCARRRGLGTKLPDDNNWIIEPLSDSTIYQMLYFIKRLIRDNKISYEQLVPEVFDYIYFGNGNIDEISKKSGINIKILENMRDEVLYWQNVDVRYTNIGHMSNHLSFLIYHYALIFPKKNWPKNITVGGYLIKDGHKISKSRGNGIPLMRMKEIYGSDLYRLYVGIAANYDIEMDFRDDDIKQLEKKYNKFKLLITSAVSLDLKEINYDDFSNINKWLISKFYSRARQYFQFIEDLRVREAFVGILYEFLNDINYHQRRTSEEETLRVLRFILDDYLILMTPVIPHFTEEIYEKYKERKDDFISLRSFDKDHFKFINNEIEEIENIIYDLIGNISRLKETKNLHKINKISIIQATDRRFDLFNKLKEFLNDKNPKKIMSELNRLFPMENKFIKKFVPKTFGSGLSVYLQKNEEFDLFNSLKEFLLNEFDAEEVEIINDNLDESNNAIPTKPIILLE